MVGRRLFSLGLVLALITSISSVSAQTQNTGAIQGRVFESGTIAPLSGAVVTITHEEIGLERSTVTDNQGYYYVGILPAGRYRITASHTGYENDTDVRNSVITGFLVHITNTEKADQPPPIMLRKVGTPSPQPAPTQPAPQPQPKPPVAPTPTAPPTPPQRTSAGEEEVSLMVNTTNATRGGNFGELQLRLLPLPGVRTFDDLALLLPGVAPAPQAIGTAVGPGIGPGVGTSGQFAVNGLRSRANNFTIDGSDNNDEEVGVRRQGFTSLVPQSIESVQEFQISTLLPEPQFGRNMGAQVNAVSKTGGASYHGTLYGFFTDHRLNARSPFDFVPSGTTSTLFSNGQTVFLNGSPLRVPDFKAGEPANTRAQYGFVFGGPIARKTHFFVALEHQDLNLSRTAHFAVPNVADRGLFQSGDKGLRINGDNLFPTTDVGDSFFSLFPFPNNPSGPYGGNTYTQVLPATSDGTIFSGRLDQNFSAFGREHNLSGRYNFADDNTILPVTGEALFSSLRPLVRAQDFALSLNSAVTNNAANQFRFSFGRTSLSFEEVRDPFLIPSRRFPGTPFLLNARLVRNFTLPGTGPIFFSPDVFDTETSIGNDVFASPAGTGPIGQVVVSGFSPVGVNVYNFPQSRSNNLFQYADTFVLNKSNHRLTFGADIRRSQLNSSIDRNFRPQAVFSAAADLASEQLSRVLSDLGSVEGFYLGKDFVAAGAPTGFYQTLALNPDSTIGLRFWQNDFFFSDQIRVRPNFTLTLGIRYELNTVPGEVNRRIESTFNAPEVAEFEQIERAISVDGQSFGSGLERYLGARSEIYGQDSNNIAPHIAFAWDPIGDGKMSIRGGYGIYYDQILGSVVSQSRNVFPNFLPINLAGLFFTGVNDPICQDKAIMFCHRLGSFNPALLAQPGTLNTFDPTNAFAAGQFSPVNNLYLNTEILTNFATGPAFVLPAADLVSPYAQHWGLTIERQVKNDFLFSVAYVGTKGSHLLRLSTPNLGLNATPVVDKITGVGLGEGGKVPLFIGFTVPPNANFSLRPFPILGSITLIESDANSTYHSLQLEAQKRFSRGIQFTAAYTWSHAIDDVSDIFDLAGSRALPQDSFSREAERGAANFDVRHRFVYSFIWDLPIFENSRALGGWQVSSIGTFQTGQPYSVLFCCDNNLDGNLTDRIDPGILNPSHAARNQFRGPGIANVDLAVNKSFRFNERHRLEARTEFFNLFNRSQFGIPVHQLFFGGLGTSPAFEDHFVDTRLANRTIQFALKFFF